MSNLKESDKVVCICDPWFGNRWRVIGAVPKQGVVYIVEKAIGPQESIDEDGTVADNQYGLVLVGSSLLDRQEDWECGWHTRNFRKLEEVQAENKLRQSEAEQLEEARQLINLY